MHFDDAVDASLGAIGNYSQRLNAKQDFLSSAILNSQSAYSRLFDADMALESVECNKSTNWIIKLLQQCLHN